MLSASYFSLLAPAAEISGIIPICGGFLLGAGFVTVADWIIGDVEQPAVLYSKLLIERIFDESTKHLSF
jgi:hypothetical protein